MGGGTAGHLFPSVAVAQRLIDRLGAEVLFIGAEGKLDSRILQQQGLPHRLIPARPFPYGLSLDAVAAVGAVLRGATLCARIAREFRADALFGAGGFVGAAGTLAAAWTGLPSVCHASDALPDRANRLLAPWAGRITTHYEAAAAHFPRAKTTVTGQPIRREFLATTPQQAREALGIPDGAFVLLVAGGSQGARTLNHATVGALDRLLSDEAAFVLHLTGAAEHQDTVYRARRCVGDHPRYRAMAFCEEPWLTTTAADLCLTRGGASGLAEMTVRGVPTVVVPYPYAAGHQRLNATELVESKAAVLIEDAELTPDRLAETVGQLRGAPERLAEMSRAALAVARPQAADDIAQIIAEVARTG